jgi:DNA invertase Pin-like site-specific DNA recombinase
MPKPKPHSGKWVSYLRVSTDRQGESGLGLEAQRKAVADYLNGGKWTLAAEFVEIESGKRSDNRPQLAAAFAACKKQRAKLVVAKLDRLSRNMAFIATMMDSGVEFVAVDNPHATRLTLHILAAVAEHERMMISQRTKAALAAAKANGRKLGGPKLAVATKLGNKANAAAADRFAALSDRTGRTHHCNLRRKLSDECNRLGDHHATSKSNQDHRGVADWPFSVCASCGVGAGA